MKKILLVLCVIWLSVLPMPPAQATDSGTTLGIIGTALGGTALGLTALNSMGFGFGRRHGGMGGSIGYGGYGMGMGYGGGSYYSAPVMYQQPMYTGYGGYGGGGYGMGYQQASYGYGGGYGGMSAQAQCCPTCCCCY